MSIVPEVLLAAARIKPAIRETPCILSQTLSERYDAEIWLKLENVQFTGSFKLRGALNRLLTLTPEQLALGVVAASSGNHGAAVAYAARALGARADVFVPSSIAAAKRAKIEAYGARIHLIAGDPLNAEASARVEATRRRSTYISPYNDPMVIAGQGTIGYELARQVPGLAGAIVAVGGGGLIAGVAAYLKHENPLIQIIGAQPERSAVMAASVAAGRVVELPDQPTLSDGTAGGVEEDSITFPMCQELVDTWALVGEAQIAAGVRLLLEHEHQIAEGAAGVAVAALEQVAEQFAGRSLAVIVCGGNIAWERVQQLMGA